MKAERENAKKLGTSMEKNRVGSISDVAGIRSSRDNENQRMNSNKRRSITGGGVKLYFHKALQWND